MGRERELAQGGAVCGSRWPVRDARLDGQPASATFSLPFFLTCKNLHIFRVYNLMSLGISVHVRNPRHHPSYNISITSPSFLLSRYHYCYRYCCCVCGREAAQC